MQRYWRGRLHREGVLVEYASKSHSTRFSRYRPNMNDTPATKGDLQAITALIKANDAPISTRKLNDLLKQEGYLEVRSRPSSTDPTKTKTFVALTDKGLEFGKNVGNNFTDETSPRYYAGQFLELLTRLGIATN